MPRLLKSLAVERLEDGVVMVKARVVASAFTEGATMLTYKLTPTDAGIVYQDLTVRPRPLPTRTVEGGHCWACAVHGVLHFLKGELDTDGPPRSSYLGEPMVAVATEEPEFPGLELPVRLVPLDSPEGQKLMDLLGVTVPPAPTKH